MRQAKWKCSIAHYMTWRNGSTRTSIGCWVWIVCASSIHSTASVLAIPFSSESIISISIIVRVYSSARQTHSEYLGNPLNRVRRKKNLPPVFPPNFISNKQTIFLSIGFNFDRFRNRLRPLRLDIDRCGRSWGGFVNVQCYAHVRNRQVKAQSRVKATTRLQAGYGISLSSKKDTKNDPRTSEEHAKMDSTTAFERFWINVVDRSLMASLASNSIHFATLRSAERQIRWNCEMIFSVVWRLHFVPTCSVRSQWTSSYVKSAMWEATKRATKSVGTRLRSVETSADAPWERSRRRSAARKTD